MNTETVYNQVNAWILEEDLPSRANMKPIRQFDELYPQDPMEADAYWEFMRWFFRSEHEALLMVPAPEKSKRFAAVELDEFGDDVSAFNTVDFERTRVGQKISGFSWQHQKALDRIRDLAIRHSVLNDEDAKRRVLERYKALVEIKYWNRACRFKRKIDRGRYGNSDVEALLDLNRKIRDCKKEWAEHAFRP